MSSKWNRQVPQKSVRENQKRHWTVGRFVTGRFICIDAKITKSRFGFVGSKSRTQKDTCLNQHRRPTNTLHTNSPDLFNQSLVQVMNGEQLGSKRVSFAINEYITRLNNSTAPQKYSTTLRIQFLERILPLFNKTLIKDVKTSTLMDIYDAMQINARGGQLSPNTIQRYSTDLKQFFAWCVERGYLQKIPIFPKIQTNYNRRPHFNNSDYSKLTRFMREFIKYNNPNIVRDRTILINYVLILSNTGTQFEMA